MKGKSKGVCSLSTKLGFPAIFLSCSLFFLAGFYASVLLSHGVPGGDGVAHRPMLHELAEEEGEKREVMLNGETGESFVARIPFQAQLPLPVRRQPQRQRRRPLRFLQED